MKNLLTAAIVAATAFTASAYTETYETMTVNHADGTTTVLDITDVTSVTFGTRTETVAYNIESAQGTGVKGERLAPLFVYVPEADGERRALMFGTQADAASVADLRQGQYAVAIEVAPTSFYQGRIELGEGAPAGVTLYTYTDGEVSEVNNEVVSGTLSTARDAKMNVTMSLDATMADGTRIRANYQGKVTESGVLADLNPAPTYTDVLMYWNADGAQTFTSTIEGVTKTVKKSGGANWLTFDFTLTQEGHTVQIQIAESQWEALKGTPIDLNTAPNNSINFRYDAIQVSGPNDQYRNIGTNGVITVSVNEDGTYTFDADVTNTYKSTWGGTGGTPERVLINYNATITE